MALDIFQKTFCNRVEKIISNNTDSVLYVFKGFAISQNEYIIKHPKSLLNNVNLFNNGCLDIEAINENWLDIVQSLSLAKGPLIAVYEELLAIRDFLSRIRIDKIIVVENNFLSPWVPSCIPYDQALGLFDYLQDDFDPSNDLIRLLSLYYGEVKLLDGQQALLLPASIEGDNIIQEPFWTQTPIYSEINDVKRIEIGSTEDWVYRLGLLHGNAAPALFLQNGKRLDPRQQALASALTTIGVKFTIVELEIYTETSVCDDTLFLPTLKKYWGPTADFRPLLFYKDPDRSRDTQLISQGQIISEIVFQCELALDGKAYQNLFITAPTGSGKSILFQLPALYLAEKYSLITIVVSPLIALMNDQVDQLQREHGISIAACINSTMTIDERLDAIAQIQSGQKSLLYLAPELLLTTHLQTFLGGRKIGLVVIDEAHTVTSWGRDFRSDYWFLGDFLKKAKRDGFVFPVLCLTATAVYSGADDVVNDTIHELGLEKTILHLGNVKRNNINFDIVQHSEHQFSVKVETVKMDMILQRMRSFIADDEKVLTYFPYRSQVDQIHSMIDQKEHIKIRRYHGQLPSPERKMVERSYKSGEAMGLVCTKAFGMGIDVGDIKHVVHFAPTGTLADYVQEIGRAARNPDFFGIAHIDYFSSDLRYVRALNGISEMRQYQLKEMLKKICSIYEMKKRRNLLVSSETFEYLFQEDEVENRTKSGLMLLAKDLDNKFSFPVLVVRPKAMLSKNYINVPYEIEKPFLKKYGYYSKRQDGETKRVITSKNHARASDVQVYSTGNTYLVNMAEIWENFYPDRSFGMFKKCFFEEEMDFNGQKYHVAPRTRVEIRYTDDYSVVLGKVEKVINAICESFTKFRQAETKQFTLQMFEAELNMFIGEKILSHEKASLLLDIFTETVDENAIFNYNRSQLRVLRKRKQSNKDETVYFVSSTAYARLPSFFSRIIDQCTPNISDNTFHRFYPLTPDKPIEIMPLLRVLELLGLATYEIRGGEKAEVFIRINDPDKLIRLSKGNYKNTVLQTINERHFYNQKLLASFFTKDMESGDRWELIEEYFLGNEDYVRSVLRLEK